jgi:hypothetical protein
MVRVTEEKSGKYEEDILPVGGKSEEAADFFGTLPVPL